MGIRRRIFIGFASLALVLFLAGAIAMSELSRMRGTVQNIIEMSTGSAEYAKRMLNALQAQNKAVVQMSFVEDKEALRNQYVAGVDDFNSALLEATQTISNRSELDAIYSANDEYQKIIEEHINTLSAENIEWFMNMYMNSYYKLDSSIKDYMTAPQNSIAMRTLLLEKSVYRTITPSILTLLVAFLIVMMFYYFLDIYYIRPILNINKGVKQYLEFGSNLNVKIEGSGEISTLKENIEKLIEIIKSKA